METAVFAITQTSQKHRNKGYFHQNDTVLIPNVTQFVKKKAYIIAIKVQKFQLSDDWQNYRIVSNKCSPSNKHPPPHTFHRL